MYVAQGVTLRICLGSSAHLGPPPTHAYQEKAPVLKKLRRFVLKGVSDELQKPTKDKQAGGNHPERMIEDCSHCQRQRDHNQWNAKAMAEPVDWMGMAACVLCDPLFAGASAWHVRIINRCLKERRVLAPFRQALRQMSYCGVSKNTRVGPAWTWLSAVTS
jgi:hypothetical protein